MVKGALAGAIALALGMTISLTPAQSMETYEQGSTLGVTVKESHISRLRAVLNLSPEQRPYWAPVESALRELARRTRQEASAGFVQRMGERASSVASEAMLLRRLRAAAGPLIQVLDDTQKRDAMVLARNLGFERLVAAF